MLCKHSRVNSYCTPYCTPSCDICDLDKVLSLHLFARHLANNIWNNGSLEKNPGKNPGKTSIWKRDRYIRQISWAFHSVNSARIFVRIFRQDFFSNWIEPLITCSIGGYDWRRVLVVVSRGSRVRRSCGQLAGGVVRHHAGGQFNWISTDCSTGFSTESSEYTQCELYGTPWIFN